MAQDSIVQIVPQDGGLYDSADLANNYWGIIPNGANTGVSLAKRPTTGAWTAFTVFPNFDRTGYVTVREQDTGTKYRIPLFDHPDGG